MGRTKEVNAILRRWGFDSTTGKSLIAKKPVRSATRARPLTSLELQKIQQILERLNTRRK